jgi:signal transduction histidine kinase/DNA-binding response OmpR family regulator
MKALLIEDDPVGRRLLEAALSSRGHEVTACADAESAWEIFQRDRHALVVTDWLLPGMDGLELCRRIRALPDGDRSVVLVITSRDQLDDLQLVLNAGASDYLAKPVEMAFLQVRLVLAERQVAEIDQRKRTEAALHEEAEKSAALVRVGRELISSLDRPVILDRLCQLAAQVLECDTSRALLWQPDEDAYAPVARYARQPDTANDANGGRVPRDLVARCFDVPHSDDVASIQPHAERQLDDAAAQAAAAEELWMALRKGDQTIGVLAARRQRPSRPFTVTQQRIARGIAQIASMALANARLLEELQRANGLKSDFVATMSHELRTPLNIIMGYGGLLVDGMFGQLTPDQARVLEQMNRSSRELLDLINATLDFSRLESGQLPLEIKGTQPSGLLRELEAEMRQPWSKQDVALVWDIPADLPPLQTDPMKLRVILKNVIGNAVKFTNHGSITVRLRCCDGGAEFTVTDTGIGMTPEALTVIFEPFRQADSSSTREHGGVGLGLHIVRRFADMLGGTISVESEYGRGSTFRMWFPSQLKLPAGSRPASTLAGAAPLRPLPPTAR